MIKSIKNINFFKPPFWEDRDPNLEQKESLFDYRKLWIGVIAIISLVASVPLFVLTFLNLSIYEKAIQAEVEYPLIRLISNTKNSISFFLEERKSALKFIVENNSFAKLSKQDELGKIYTDFQKAFGGIVDLGIINSKGTQTVYVGPYNLKGKNYENQEWYKEVILKEYYVSDIFLGYRNMPHFIIAIKKMLPNGDFFILRSTIDTNKFNQIISSLETDSTSDAFILNEKNILQTDSKFFGKVLSSFPIELPKCKAVKRICEITDHNGLKWLLGYTRIPNSPFIFALVKKPLVLRSGLNSLKKETFYVLGFSLIIVLGVVIFISTSLVTKIYYADMRRLALLHKAEHSNKLASIGRLAAGVAHEINNPLAIINEKAGLMKDLFIYSKKYQHDKKLLDLVESILKQVERCREITHRLLGFARHVDVKMEEVDLESLIKEVLSFLHKEAEYRGIDVKIVKKHTIPLIKSDRGKLQQIFLNIINNAFAAVSKGGHIIISLESPKQNIVRISITDDGIGIPKENLKKIFEPFFSTKQDKGGTGLGLSITYGLVKKLKGDISVKSEVGKGTTFTISLPVNP